MSSPLNSYKVWRPGYGETREDAQKVDALGFAAAVEQWAEESDGCGDYTIISGEPETVLISGDYIGGPTYQFTVRGESVPEYTAEGGTEVAE